MRDTHAERGSVLIMYTLAIVMMMGVLGLVVDIGWAYYRRQAAQAAADAAVLAAAAASTSAPDTFTCGLNFIACQSPTTCGTSIPNPPTNNLQVGYLYAQSNGFSASNGQTVLISANTTSPAPGVPGVQVPYWITVSINESEAQTFSSIFGNTILNVGAHATASVFPAPGDCVYALANAGIGLSLSGGPNVSTACGIFVDSNASDALSLNGAGATLTVTGAQIDIVGSYSQGTGTISPTPTTGLSLSGDPLAGMPAPAGSCTSGGVSIGSHTVQTINPGVYCGYVSAGAQSTLNLTPGIYILENGIGVGGQATLNGTGVTLYIQSGGFTVAGGGSVYLTAPLSGTYQGISVFQSRTDTTAMSLVGGTSQFINGAIYAPAAALNYTGGATGVSLSTLLITNTISFVGNSNITATPKTGFSGGAGGPTLIQ